MGFTWIGAQSLGEEDSSVVGLVGTFTMFHVAADHMSMGALGDSYFEYLLKEWLRSGREDQESRQMYDEAMQAVMTHMLRTSTGGLMYFSDLKFDRLEHKMDHLACFSGTLSTKPFLAVLPAFEGFADSMLQNGFSLILF